MVQSLAKKAGEILDSPEVKAAGLSDSDDKVHEGNPDVYFTVDPVQAALVGLSATQIQDQVRTALFGNVINTVAQTERLINIRVRLADELRSDLDRLATLPIATPSGKVVPLEQLVSFTRRRTPTEIWRKNQQRGLDVTGDLENTDRLGAVIKAIQPKLAELEKTLPAGYRIELAGQYESQQQSFQSLTTMLIVSAALVFLLLAFQFRSLVLPLLIFLTQPLSLGCAMLALWITRHAAQYLELHRRDPADWSRREERNHPDRIHRAAFGPRLRAAHRPLACRPRPLPPDLDDLAGGHLRPLALGAQRRHRPRRRTGRRMQHR